MVCRQRVECLLPVLTQVEDAARRLDGCLTICQHIHNDHVVTLAVLQVVGCGGDKIDTIMLKLCASICRA